MWIRSTAHRRQGPRGEPYWGRPGATTYADRAAGGLRRSRLADLALRAVQPRRAVRRERLTAAPQPHPLLERELTAFQLRDDGRELVPRVLVGQLGDVGELGGVLLRTGLGTCGHIDHPNQPTRANRRPDRRPGGPRSRRARRVPATARP